MVKKPFKSKAKRPIKSSSLQKLQRQVVRNTKFTNSLTRQRASGPFRPYVSADPFKPYHVCKLTYTNTQVYSSGVGGVYGTEAVYRLNSIFDPDFGVGTKRPYGYNEVSTLYAKYKVFAVKVKVDFYDPQQDGVIIGMMFQPSNAAYSLTGKALDAVKEKPMSVTRNISNTGSQRGTVSQYFTIDQIQGLTPLQFKADASDSYNALMTADPVETPYFRIAVVHATATGASLVARTSITYYTQCYDRKTKPLSAG